MPSLSVPQRHSVASSLPRLLVTLVALALTSCQGGSTTVGTPSGSAATGTADANSGATGLNGLPTGHYACRLDTNHFVASDLDITADGMYTGGVASSATGPAPLSYDPASGTITFQGGFFNSDAIPAHHLIGQYPSQFPGDSSATILLMEEPGHPDDSSDGPAVQGSSSGLWHCTQ